MQLNKSAVGEDIYELARRLYPINRSITGEGNRQTLGIIKEIIPSLEIKEIKSGSQCFDWTIPPEWDVKAAWVRDSKSNIIIDFANHNLHLVGYSMPVDEVLSYDELQARLFSREDMPDAIPYITSYYKESWGFCISHNDRLKLDPNESYHVYIDSSFNKDGSLIYGELIIPGKSEKEIFISSYICHPSIANNELSGPCLLTYIAKAIIEMPNRYYTYRVILIPETIGAIAYLSENINAMKSNIYAGFNLTCVGDNRSFSFMPSRNGDTIVDRMSRHVLSYLQPEYVPFTYLQRGSDERQYCSAGVDLPVVSIMRTKYAEFPEYHTSKDDLTVISPNGFAGSFEIHMAVLEAIERNHYPVSKVLCEPQMGRRGLRPERGVSNKISSTSKLLSNIMAYSDGKITLLEMAEIFNIPIWELYQPIDTLIDHNLIQLDNYASF